MNAVKSIYKADVNGKTFTFFHADYNVGCDGYEIPMPWENKHYLYARGRGGRRKGWWGSIKSPN